MSDRLPKPRKITREKRALQSLRKVLRFRKGAAWLARRQRQPTPSIRALIHRRELVLTMRFLIITKPKAEAA